MPYYKLFFNNSVLSLFILAYVHMQLANLQRISKEKNTYTGVITGEYGKHVTRNIVAGKFDNALQTPLVPLPEKPHSDKQSHPAMQDKAGVVILQYV